MFLENIKSLKEFEKIFFDKLKNFSNKEESVQKTIEKFYELIVLKDKASPVAFTDKETLRRISIVLTTQCNLKCVWCHREEKHVQESGYLEKKNNFNKLMDLFPKLEGFHVLHWGGLGEPLLAKDIYELSTEVRKYIPIVKTTSNGTTLTKKTIPKILNSGINYLEVSIDGFDDVTNLKLRGSDENIIIENLKYLSENSKIPLQINSVVSEENFNSLKNSIDKLKDIKNIISIHAIPLFMTKHMQDLGIKKLANEKFKTLLNHWQNEINRLSLNWSLSPSATDVEFDPVVFMKQKHNICFSPFQDPSINVNGEIAPCSRLQHLGLGNVFDSGFDEVWNGKKMQEFRKQQLEGNYGHLCQRECNMKVTSTLSDKERLKKLKKIHPSLEI